MQGKPYFNLNSTSSGNTKKCFVLFFKNGVNYLKKKKAPYVVAFIVDHGFSSTPKQEMSIDRG